MDKVLAYASAYGTMTGSMGFLDDIGDTCRQIRKGGVDQDEGLLKIESFANMLRRQFANCRAEVLAVEMAERFPAGTEIYSWRGCRLATGPK